MCRHSCVTAKPRVLPRGSCLYRCVATCARRCGVTAGALRNFAYVCGFCKQSSTAKVRFSSPVVPHGKAYCAEKHFPAVACGSPFSPFFVKAVETRAANAALVHGGNVKIGRVASLFGSVMRHCLPSKCSFARVVKSNDLWYNKQQGIAFKRKWARSQRSSP